jgi:hypothetical protein
MTDTIKPFLRCSLCNRVIEQCYECGEILEERQTIYCNEESKTKVHRCYFCVNKNKGTADEDVLDERKSEVTV